MNPVLAPRNAKCRCCQLVATIEDVTIRLYDPELNPLPVIGAVEYLRSVGLTGTNRQLQAFALSHRRHVDKWLERGAAIAPADLADGVSRIPAPMGNTRWLDVNQQGMDIGAQAATLLIDRMQSGGMEDKDLISVAKLGQNAAMTRATLELKGAIKRKAMELQLASGFKRPEQESA